MSAKGKVTSLQNVPIGLEDQIVGIDLERLEVTEEGTPGQRDTEILREMLIVQGAVIAQTLVGDHTVETSATALRDMVGTSLDRAVTSMRKEREKIGSTVAHLVERVGTIIMPLLTTEGMSSGTITAILIGGKIVIVLLDVGEKRVVMFHLDAGVRETDGDGRTSTRGVTLEGVDIEKIPGIDRNLDRSGSYLVSHNQVHI